MPTYYTIRVIPRSVTRAVDVFLISARDPRRLATLDSLNSPLPDDVQLERIVHPDESEAIKLGQWLASERGWHVVNNQLA